MKKQNYFIKVLYLLIFTLSMSGAVFGQAPNVTASSYAVGATNVTYTFTYKTTQFIPADALFFEMWFPCGMSRTPEASCPNPMGYSGPPTAGVIKSYPNGYNYYAWYPQNISVTVNGTLITSGFLPLGCSTTWDSGVQLNRHVDTPAGTNVVVTVTGINNPTTPGTRLIAWSSGPGSGTGNYPTYPYAYETWSKTLTFGSPVTPVATVAQSEWNSSWPVGASITSMFSCPNNHSAEGVAVEVSASNLFSNLTVTASSLFQIYDNSDGVWKQSIIFSPTYNSYTASCGVPDQISEWIPVRMKASATNGIKNGTISLSATGMTTVSLPVSGRVGPIVAGTITGPSQVCSGTGAEVTLTGYSGYYWEWEESDNINGPWEYFSWSDPFATTNPVTQTKYIRAFVSAGTNNNGDYNSCGVVYTQPFMITPITPSPLSLSAISGSSSLSSSATTATYSVPAVAGATGYVWDLPAGMTLTSQTGPSVTVAVSSTFTSGTVRVKALNSCSETTQSSLTVTKAPLVTFSLTGSTTLCPDTQQVYTATSVSGGTYVWTVPSTVTIVSGQGTNSLTIAPTASFVSGQVKVVCTTGSSSQQASLMVSGTTQPSVITGPSNICGLTTATYSVVETAGVSYQWTLPEGMSIVSGGNSSSITVSISGGSVSGLLSVRSVSSCGISLPRTMTIGSTPILGTIAGSTVVCGAVQATIDTNGQILNNNPANQYVYKVSLVPGVTSYQWTVPSGATLVSGQGSNIILVSYDLSSFNSGIISVQGVNSCGTGVARTLSVSTVSGSISGPVTICGLTTATYSVPSDLGNNFVWTLPQGMTITGGSGTSSITVGITHPIDFASGNQVSVSFTTACGGSKTLNFTVSCNEYTKLTASYCGATSIAPSQWLFVNAVPGATSYKYNVYDATGTNLVFSTERSVTYFRFLENTFTYGATYKVRVQAKIGGVYGIEGVACSVTIQDANAALQAAYCGATNVTPSQWLFVNNVVGATAYKYNVYDATGANLVFSTERSVNFFRFLENTFAYGTTYQVRVQVKQGDSYGVEGSACSVTIQGLPTTSLATSSCGASNVTPYQLLYANSVVGATGYKFNVYDEAGTTLMFSQERSVPNFRFLDSPFVYGQIYQVKVQVKQGNTYGSEGSSCSVLLSKMPITSLVASQCNSTINTASDIIYATAVAGVASYRFTIYDSNSAQVAQIERPNNYFKLNDFAYVAGVTYSVAVATKQEGQAYGLNGGLCTISTPAPAVRVTAVGEDHKVDASDVEVLTFKLYPNPFQTGFVIVPIATDLGAKVSYEVFDLTGKLIESNVLNVEVVQNYTIGEEYARGMYIVHVKQGTTSQTFKMIKQ